MVNPVTDPSGSCPFLRPDSHMVLLSQSRTSLKHAEDCPDLQKKRENDRTREINGKIIEVRLLSNTPSARRLREQRSQIVGKMKLPLSDRPVAQSRKEYCWVHTDSGDFVEVKKLSNHPVARRSRMYRLRMKKKKVDAKKGNPTEDELRTEVSNDFWTTPPEPASTSMPAYRLGTIPPILRHAPPISIGDSPLPVSTETKSLSNGFDPSHSQWA